MRTHLAPHPMDVTNGIQDTLHRVIGALGRPQVLREIGSCGRLLAAVGRWRHNGALLDLQGSATFQFVFNVSGGQLVRIQSREHSTSTSIRAGTIGLLAPRHSTSVAVAGQADILQVFLSPHLIETLTGRPASFPPPRFALVEPPLQAAAVQALVALERPDHPERTTELAAIVNRIVSLISCPPRSFQAISRGGLSPSASRRVHALIDRRLQSGACNGINLPGLAAAAGLSVHHFIRAFRCSEGTTPYARILALRFDHALSLLLRPDARVDHIGDATGFSSSSHFVSAFRTRMGVTPGALRDAALSRS